MSAKLNTSHLFVCLVTLDIQGGACYICQIMAIAPLHTVSQCMGENRRTLSTILHSSLERGRVNLIHYIQLI